MALTDRELLAKTLQAEAGNQGIGGMLAVGSVIRNRMAQGGSLSDVILAPAQFSAWNKVTGAVGGEQGQDMAALKPSEDAYAAADAILSGNAPDVTGGATHYYNPSISNPAWGKEKAGGDWTKIGAHIFGKAGDFKTGAAKMNGEQTQKPQGLLGGLLGGQGIGGALGLSPEFSDKLAMAVMAGTGDARLQPLIAQRALNMKERKAQGARNVTADYLEKIGQVDAANLLRQGAVSASEAFDLGKGSKSTDDIREYELAKKDGFEGSFTDFLRVKQEFGSTPQGYRLVRGKDKQGKDTYGYVKVEGGPAAQEDIEAQKAKEAKERTALQDELTFNATGSRILSEITNDPSFIPATGLIGTAFAKTPFGQRQKDIQEELEVLEAQMQFGALADLKASSANGSSGLGQLTEAERRALGKTRFNFSSMQGPEAVARNIRAAMMVRSYFKNGIVDTKTGELRNATAEEFKKMMNGENPFSNDSQTHFAGDIQNYIGGFEGVSAAAQPTAGSVTHIYNPQTGKVEPVK